MSGHVLILNAGSSSLKFRVYELGAAADDWKVAAGGQIEGIGKAPRFHAKDGAEKTIADDKLPTKSDARAALDALAKWLRTRFGAKGLVGVGHRVVHGGASYAAPVIVTTRVLDDLRALEPLAPLHQPYNLEAIAQLLERVPDVPQVACFDTGFHRGWSDVAQLVPLPAEIRRAGVQRYGFHGISYEYIAGALPRVAPEIASGRVIVAHLGSGASLCALKNGKSVDCTMGFTALDGLCMGTRPGALDPGVVLHLFQALALSAKEVETMLYKKSGLLGISGFSNDMRELLARSDSAARLAVDYFVYRAAKEIGALAAVLGGVDALVFTAGIGERSAQIRRRISTASEWLGLAIDEAANGANESRISTPASRVSVWAIPTNEELVIAQHTRALLERKPPQAGDRK
jgi:acetate kinase